MQQKQKQNFKYIFYLFKLSLLLRIIKAIERAAMLHRFSVACILFFDVVLLLLSTQEEFCFRFVGHRIKKNFKRQALSLLIISQEILKT